MNLTAVILVSLGLAAAPPSPSAPIPRTPVSLADTLTSTSSELRDAIDAWSSKSTDPPEPVVLYALYQQRIYRLLAHETTLAAATMPRLTPPLRRVSADLLAAQRELYRLTPPLPAVTIRTGRAPPASSLLRYYREAQRRFGVSWSVLASINFVESKFGKLRNGSAAGAQGPMQFMPATWRQYGLGGNVRDAHDAILGAANYLRASGARHNIRRALHAYNPSPAYVDAVQRYARRLREDQLMFYELYNWQVFVKTTRGDRRVTGPGLP